jgi:hypothetical protein
MQLAAKVTGLRLLQILTRECTTRRFMLSLSAWGSLFLACERSSEAQAVQEVAWAGLRDLFLRVHSVLDLPGMRQEGAALAGKLSGPVMALLKKSRGMQPYLASQCSCAKAFTIPATVCFKDVKLSQCH